MHPPPHKGDIGGTQGGRGWTEKFFGWEGTGPEGGMTSSWGRVPLPLTPILGSPAIVFLQLYMNPYRFGKVKGAKKVSIHHLYKRTGGGTNWHKRQNCSQSLFRIQELNVNDVSVPLFSKNLPECPKPRCTPLSRPCRSCWGPWRLFRILQVLQVISEASRHQKAGILFSFFSHHKSCFGHPKHNG